MFIHEIFTSINGETSYSGEPTTFVRLFGCNVQCTYCDQPQTKKDRKKMCVKKVVDEVRKRMVTNVCITGGEPLLQDEVYQVIYELCDLGYNVIVETNGTIPIDDYSRRSYHFIMDVKTPSSGVEHLNQYSNLEVLLPNDEVKFVIADRKDYEYMKRVLKNYSTSAKILVSPMFDKDLKPVIGKELIDWILEDKLNVKVQIQIHKVLGVL